MENFVREPVYIKNGGNASAFLFDLRNSTKITRYISSINLFYSYVEFMMELHKFIYSTIYDKSNFRTDDDEFAINDTGDGYICAFWSKYHPIDCLKIASKIWNYLNIKLPEYNKSILKNVPINLSCGFSFHTGALTVQRLKYNNKDDKFIYKDFMLGILVNTVSKLEKLNKLYVDYNSVVSGNFKKCFVKTAKTISRSDLADLFDPKNKFVKKSLGRINIDDGKNRGHHIYMLDNIFYNEFTNIEDATMAKESRR